MKQRTLALILVLVLIAAMLPAMQAEAALWGGASLWAEEELERAAALGLIPDRFHGEDLTKPITRAEFAAVAVKAYAALGGSMEGQVNSQSGKSPFQDTADPDVLIAYTLGIVNGTGAGVFSPDRVLDRETAATMLARVYKKACIPGWTLENDADFPLRYSVPTVFSDDDAISDWARDSVYFMVANEVLKGVGNNRFAPRNATAAQSDTGYASATREQAIVIALRMVEKLGNTEQFGDLPDTEQEFIDLSVPDASGIYTKPLEEEHIAEGRWTIDGESRDTLYVDNEILLVAADGVTKAQIENLMETYHGRIVGEIPSQLHYQIELETTPEAGELSALLDALNGNALIKNAYLNTVSEISTNSMPLYPYGDTWNEKDTRDHPIWNEGYPDGNNWGVEAINAPSAWQMLLQAKGGWSGIPSVRVGVIDSIFDLNHDDLFIAKYGGAYKDSINKKTESLAQKAPSESENIYGTLAHGTHVAGIIGARQGNGGISGVAMKTELCVFSMYQKVNKKEDKVEFYDKKAFSNEYYLEVALSRLIESEEARIINYSMSDDVPVSAITQLLRGYLDGVWKNGSLRKYDFLIVTAAGNSSNQNAGTVSAFNRITDPEVSSRIIVVGAAEVRKDAEGLRFKFYESYSGGSRIDVVAPGIDIYSTVPKNDKISGTKKGYYPLSGTSQAAPHVSGIAALVWAARPSWTGRDIKNCIVDNADIALSNRSDLNMVNAAKAVAAALGIDYIIEGTCGAAARWSFDKEQGTLTISGSGPMDNYTQEGAAVPWFRYKDSISDVVFDGDITSVGSYAFFQCSNLSQVSGISEKLSAVGEGAFYGTRLSEITLPGPELKSVSANPKELLDPDEAYPSYPSFPQNITLNVNGWTLDNAGKWKGYNTMSYFALYRKIVENLEQSCGYGRLRKSDLYSGAAGFLLGVPILRLMDMDGDGYEELIVGYSLLNEKDVYSPYFFGTVYSFDGKNVISLAPVRDPEHSNGYAVWMRLVRADEKWYFVHMDEDWFEGGQDHWWTVRDGTFADMSPRRSYDQEVLIMFYPRSVEEGNAILQETAGVRERLGLRAFS